MKQPATKRINEIYNELGQGLTTGPWSSDIGSLSKEILAIKRYLDELANKQGTREEHQEAVADEDIPY